MGLDHRRLDLAGVAPLPEPPVTQTHPVADPARSELIRRAGWHQERESRFFAQVRNFLASPTASIPSRSGPVVPASLQQQESTVHRHLDVKREMIQRGLIDRELQDAMPAFLAVNVDLARRSWFGTKAVGRLSVVNLTPVGALLQPSTPPAVGATEVRAAVKSGGASGTAQELVVLFSSTGFDESARALVHTPEMPPVILAEARPDGGWRMTASGGLEAVAQALDPETDAEKRRRLRLAIDESGIELMGAGLRPDDLAERLNLPMKFVEEELRSLVGEVPGLRLSRIEGRLVLLGNSRPPTGDASMPILEKIRALFRRKGDTDRKIAFLEERRAALMQQRERGYEQVSALEAREAELRAEFPTAASESARRRITGQLLQVRKDLDRRQQLLTLLNQQVNVVATHLHNLELIRQGTSAKLPDSEQLARDAEAAEEILVRVQADSDLADSVSVSGAGGLSADEQALYEELTREAAKTRDSGAQTSEGNRQKPAAEAGRKPEQTSEPLAGGKSPEPAAENRRRNPAEPG
jgi:hypothetical protein